MDETLPIPINNNPGGVSINNVTFLNANQIGVNTQSPNAALQVKGLTSKLSDTWGVSAAAKIINSDSETGNATSTLSINQYIKVGDEIHQVDTIVNDNQFTIKNIHTGGSGLTVLTNPLSLFVGNSVGLSHFSIDNTDGTVCLSGMTCTRVKLSENVMKGDVLSVSTTADKQVELCKSGVPGNRSVCGIALETGVAGEIINMAVGGLIQVNVTNATGLGDFLAVDVTNGKATSRGKTDPVEPGIFATSSSTTEGAGVVMARFSRSETY
jgi:hypothetical protein